MWLIRLHTTQLWNVNRARVLCCGCISSTKTTGTPVVVNEFPALLANRCYTTCPPFRGQLKGTQEPPVGVCPTVPFVTIKQPQMWISVHFIVIVEINCLFNTPSLPELINANELFLTGVAWASNCFSKAQLSWQQQLALCIKRGLFTIASSPYVTFRTAYVLGFSNWSGCLKRCLCPLKDLKKSLEKIMGQMNDVQHTSKLS